jgi:3-oxoacyl-[acyl-carrier protein] reductase
MNTLPLLGKTALVCGSSQGIGAACAYELAAMGASVVLLARNPSALLQVKQSLPSPDRHTFYTADFSAPGELEKCLPDIVSKHTIHILVNNTGGPPAGTIEQARPEEFLQAFRSHLLCNHLLVQSVLPGMKRAAYGRIINIISTSVKQPLKGLGVSNTIRAAVANWSKTLAGEVAAAGITVNNVLPGATLTGRLENIISNKAGKSGLPADEIEKEMLAEIPAGRFGTPPEIAAAVGFLASPAASYINGINLPVDGGRTGCL